MYTLPFNDFVPLWIEDKKNYVKRSTMSLYRNLLKTHLLPCFGDAVQFDVSSVERFILERTASGLSRKTVRDCVTLLRGILRWGHAHHYCEYPSWTPRYPPVTKKKDVESLSRDEQRKLSKYCRDHFSFRNIGIYISMMSGLRIGEVCALQWKDIDRERKVIVISKTVERLFDEGRTLLAVNTPKTPSSNREVPIPHALFEYLRPFARVMNPEHFVVSGCGGPADPRTLRTAFGIACKEAMVRTVRFHCLRHSFATRLVETGCDVKTVSVLLGHASVSTTMNLYVHPGMEQKRKALGKLERLLV